MNDDELTPSEKEALESLPRERMPRAGLEDRVAGALRGRGILGGQGRRVAGSRGIRTAAVLAASVALILGGAGGFALGHWSGARNAGVLIDTRGGADASGSGKLSAAAAVQEVGTAYVQALENLAALPDSVNGGERLQGREVALTTFYTAADQVTRLVPKDYLARQLLMAINVTGKSGSGTRSGATGETRFVQF